MNYSGRSLGQQAEERFFEVFREGLLRERLAKKFLPDSSYAAMRASYDQDTKEGTDFFYGGIRFDFAICYRYSVKESEENFVKEGMVKSLKDKVKGYTRDLYLGVRCKNKDTTKSPYFVHPVIVIGWSCNNMTEVNDLCHFIDSHWDEIYKKAKALRKRYKKGEKYEKRKN